MTAITTVPVAGEGGAGGEGIDDDGNPETTSDPAWLPYLTTPNHPEYVSGHSATGAAAAGVLAYWFGDDTSFAVGSDSAPRFTLPRLFRHECSHPGELAIQELPRSRSAKSITLFLANEQGTWI